MMAAQTAVSYKRIAPSPIKRSKFPQTNSCTLLRPIQQSWHLHHTFTTTQVPARKLSLSARRAGRLQTMAAAGVIDARGLRAKAPMVASLVGEFVGTALFTLFGTCAAAQFAPWTNGLALAVFVYIFASVSGGHLNPAVSAGIWISGHISFNRLIGYVAAQVVGACAGIAMQAALCGGSSVLTGAVRPGIAQFSGVTAGQAFGWEAIMTFVLVLTVLEVAVYDKKWGGIFGPWVVGVSLWASALVGGQFTGAFLNPARVLGPAIVWGSWQFAGLYCMAQLLGGVVAGSFARILEGQGSTEEEEGPRDIGGLDN